MRNAIEFPRNEIGLDRGDLIVAEWFRFELELFLLLLSRIVQIFEKINCSKTQRGNLNFENNITKAQFWILIEPRNEIQNRKLGYTVHVRLNVLHAKTADWVKRKVSLSHTQGNVLSFHVSSWFLEQALDFLRVIVWL